MKKVKWILTILILITMVILIIYLGKLRWNNPDMTEQRLLITFWKEYLISTILCLAGYLGIRKLMR